MAIETLVMVEKQGRFPEWLDPTSPELFAFEQEDFETAEAFLIRAERFVGELSSSAERAVLICGNAGDLATEHARRSLLVTMVDHLERGSGGNLIIVADGDYGSRQSLADLAWELNGFLDEVDSPVSCRLRAQPRSVAPEAIKAA
jgi:hypothetical protein